MTQITNFGQFLQEKEGVNLTMCNLTIHRLTQLVDEFIAQLYLGRQPSIKWNDTKVSRPLSAGSLTKESKLLLVISRSGNLFKAYYNTETGIFHLQGATDTHVDVEWWVEFDNPNKSATVQKITESLGKLDNEAMFSRRRIGGVIPDDTTQKL